MNALSRFADPVYAVLRLIVGLMFASHGAQKVFGMFGGKVAQTGDMIFAGWVELVGGLLIAFGLLTRPTAFLCSGLMAVAYFKAHAPQGWHPVMNRGELAVVYCFLFLFMFMYGPGRYALDSLIFRNRARNDDTMPIGSRG
jgi:putative oxidoreductase